MPIKDSTIRKNRRMELERNGSVTLQELRDIVKRDESKCIYCGVKVNPHCTSSLGDARGFDHLIPLSNGGEHSAWNMAVCCMKCNTKKGQTAFVDFVLNNDFPLRWFDHLDERVLKTLMNVNQKRFIF